MDGLVLGGLLDHASQNGVASLIADAAAWGAYNTAWSMKQKTMQVMKERDDSKPLGGTVQLDDAYCTHRA